MIIWFLWIPVAPSHMGLVDPGELALFLSIRQTNQGPTIFATCLCKNKELISVS
jgi:hypothetical protein